MKRDGMDAYACLVRALQKKYRARDRAVAQLLDAQDPERAAERAQAMRETLAKALLPWPAPPAEGRVVKRYEGDGYAIENVIIESREGDLVPLNLYLPQTAAPPWPAVVVSLGHWPEGKAMRENRVLCANLARLGIAAATYDPLCQGERAPFDAKELARRFGPLAEDMQAVSLHMQPGNLAYLLGKNLGGQFLRDSRWAVDHLCARPEIDAGRIGAAGQSGGGTQTTWLAALDERIRCYAPIQCLTQQSLALAGSGIGDCEQSILGISAGREGFDYADVLWAAFPKPCRVCAAQDDFFPLAGVRHLESELTRLYALAGAAQDFSVRVVPGGHWPGPETRLLVYDFFCRQFLGRPGPAQEPDFRLPQPEQLACLMPGRQGRTAAAALGPALRSAQAARPKDPAELKTRLEARFLQPPPCCGVSPLWQQNGWAGALLDPQKRRPAAFRYRLGGHPTLCVSVLDPGASPGALHALAADWLDLLPWGMHSAYAKRTAGYDEETMLFNASAVLGKSILRLRLRQLAGAVRWLEQAAPHQTLLFVGQGPGAVLALLAAALLPRAGGAVLLDAQLGWDELFDAPFYQLAETTIDPGLPALCDLPGLAGLAGRVCAVNPLGPDALPLARGSATPIPAVWARDGWAAAAAWLKEELC